MSQPNGQQLPAGYTVDDSPAPAPSQGSALPQGYTVDDAPHDAQQAPAIHVGGIDPNAPWYDRIGQGVQDLTSRAEAVGNGMGQGLTSTLQGAASIANKVGQHTVGHDIVPKTVTDSLNEGQQRLQEQNRENPGLNEMGYGGETLMEFLGGEAAFKGLAMGDKLQKMSQVFKVIEQSPRLMNALKLGTAGMKAAAELSPEEAQLVQQYPKIAKLIGIGSEALRAGTVQGAQTFDRTGGDLGAAAKSGAEMAGTAGVLGTVGAGLGAGAKAVGKAIGKVGETAGDLADATNAAPDSLTVGQRIQGALQNAKDKLHANYETGIQDLQGRLGDATAPADETSPIAQKAKELLQDPDPEDHPLTTGAKEVSGEKLSPKTRALLEMAASGKAPVTEEAEEAAAEANKNKPTILGADGKAVEQPDVEPKQEDLPDWNIENLVRFRQTVGKAARDSVPGSPDQRALNALLWDGSANGGAGGSAIDDTIQNIAENSDHPEAAQALDDYQALRNNYLQQIGRYDNPIIKRLMEGKSDEAASAFLRYKSASGAPKGGAKDFNLDNLQQIIGPEASRNFAKDVFSNLLQKTSDNGQFNAAKFTGLWNKLTDETKENFFGANAPTIGPKDYMESLAGDAKTVKNLQLLNRAGLIGGVGAAAGTISPVAGAGLSTLLAFVAGHEGGVGGIQHGRELIDFVANHPKTWAGFRAAGKLAEKGDLGTAGPGAFVRDAGTGAKNIIKAGANAAIAPGAQQPTLNEPVPSDNNDSAPTYGDPKGATLPPALENVQHAVQPTIVQGQGGTAVDGRGSVAEVDQGAGNNTIRINNQQAYDDNKASTTAHELTHVWQNNLPPSIQAKIPADPQNGSAFDISDVDSLRKQGKTMTDIPREKQATIVQKYTQGDAKTKARLQPWLDDIEKTPLSSNKMETDAKGNLKITPRAPGLPPSSVAGMRGLGTDDKPKPKKKSS